MWGSCEPNPTFIVENNPTACAVGCLCSHYLSSRAVTRQVLSAQMSLTSVFGMGTGGPSLQSIRTMWMATHHLCICQKRFRF